MYYNNKLFILFLKTQFVAHREQSMLLGKNIVCKNRTELKTTLSVKMLTFTFKPNSIHTVH
jgi:hypothetical protein